MKTRVTLSSALSLALVACGHIANESTVSTEPAPDAGSRQDAEPSSPREEPTSESDTFAFVETTAPEDFGPCFDESFGDAPAGHAFCPGAHCGQCSSERPAEMQVFARASELGEGVKFVTFKDHLLLAEDGDQKPLLYALDDGSFDTVRLEAIVFEAPPPPEMKVRALVGSAVKGQGYALFCDEASCILYDFHDDNGAKVAKSRSITLPIEPEGVVGMFMHTAERPSPLCVFGDGIHCLKTDGSFDTLATGDLGRFLAVDEAGAWLVGENGRIARLDGAKLTEPYRGIDARLHAVVSGHWGEFAWAAGEGGIFLSFGKEAPIACQSEGHDIAFGLTGERLPRGWIDRDGTWLESPLRGRWCSWTPPLGDILAAAIHPCGISENRWLLSAEEFHGEWRCVYPP